MPSHTAKTLFDMNIESAEQCVQVHEGIEKLGSKLDIAWLLRASVVFAVSALDAYFHDKIKYRAGRFGITGMPPAMAMFNIPLRELTVWEKAKRKGNVLRNWLVDHFSTIPLQKRDVIKDALRLVGIDDLWGTIEPNSPARETMLADMDKYIRRRNQIAHEGDRQSSRRSGKKLRPIDRPYAQSSINFVKELVTRIEKSF